MPQFDLVVRTERRRRTSAPRFRDDIGIKNGRIRRSAASCRRAAKVIEADGLIVAPGSSSPHALRRADLLGPY